MNRRLGSEIVHERPRLLDAEMRKIDSAQGKGVDGIAVPCCGPQSFKLFRLQVHYGFPVSDHYTRIRERLWRAVKRARNFINSNEFTCKAYVGWGFKIKNKLNSHNELDVYPAVTERGS